MNEINGGKIQFRIELILALIIAGLACVSGFSNLLFISNDLYPYTLDAMGHMAKVRFLAESLSRGEFPSWFPYWYNGATVSQYYPPLSYWIMAPIFLATKNAMLTFKIYCFMMIFIGGVGVWHFCRTNIGRWCGLIGAVLFCIQPYILQTFFAAGLLAQGPVIALTPWYLTLILSYGKCPNAAKFLTITLLCALMILSHPMTIFMICFCVMGVLLVFVILKRILFIDYICLALSIVFAGILTAFWSLVGVTGLETPGIPYLLVEAALSYTANIDWYITLNSTFFYFAVPVTAVSILAALVYANRALTRKASQEERYGILFCILLTFFTMLFSFGLNLPLFQYLPLAESYVPGRILGVTSATGSILFAYFIDRTQQSVSSKKAGLRLIASVFCLIIIGSTLFFMNPYKTDRAAISDDKFNDMFSSITNNKSSFEKGRYANIGATDSSETYFSLTDNYNTTIGWNIEGTPHNQALWNESIALATGNQGYIAKNLAFWNVRSVYTEKESHTIIEELSKKYGYELKAVRDDRNFHASDTPSSYFLTEKRNALIFGAGSPGMAMEFPYLVHEQRQDIIDYSFDELEHYKLIYLCEPSIDSLKEKEQTEKIVEKLVNQGITVIIEPSVPKGFSLFDVVASDVRLEESPFIKREAGSTISSSAAGIVVDENMNYGRALFGLDEVYYKLIQNNGDLENDIIGAKNAGNGEVVFIGMHLSQFLKAVYARNWGIPETGPEYPECSDEVRSLFDDIFKTYGVNMDFWPDPFPVKKEEWNYKGVNFKYSSPKDRQMTLSVTYTPRWKAILDGEAIDVGQKENLITLDLPAGEHEVTLEYGLTKYGIAGYIISLSGLILLIIFIKLYGIVQNQLRQIYMKIVRSLQLNNDE